MRNTIIGAVLAVAFIAVLFVMARMNPHAPTTESLDTLAAHVQSGYVGNQKLGDWDLNCATTAQMLGGDQKQQPKQPKQASNQQTPVPLSLSASGTTETMTPPEQTATDTTATTPPATTPPATTTTQAKKPTTPSKPISLGRCHVTKAFHSKQNPKQTVMVVSFRLIGAERNLGIILRMAPLAKKGESVILAFSAKEGIKIPVLGCVEKQGCTAMRAIGSAPQAQLFAAPQAVLVFPQHGNAQRPQVRLPMTGLTEAITAMRRADSKG